MVERQSAKVTKTRRSFRHFKTRGKQRGEADWTDDDKETFDSDNTRPLNTSNMSRRRSARLQKRGSSLNPPGVLFDERLDFLRHPRGDEQDLPIRARFEHRIETATGPVEVVYWPSRSKESTAPEQLTLFILGQPTEPLRSFAFIY